MNRIFLIFIGAICTSSAQLLYPDDKQFTQQSVTNRDIVYPQDYVQYMEAPNGFVPTYNKQNVPYNPLSNTNAIISRGVLNLTLATNRAVHVLKKADTDVSIYSPVGIASALALVLLGSSGKTFSEIASIMGLDNGLNIESSSQTVHEQIGQLLNDLQSSNNLYNGIKVNLATALFVQEGYPVRSIYQKSIKQIYKSDIFNVDFANSNSRAETVINNWVKEKTNNKISYILTMPPSTDTKVILCSALYFMGPWENPFFAGLTQQRPFYPYGRKSKYSVQVDMMANGGMFPYYKDNKLDCEILGFPYKGNKTTMYIIMPKYSNKQKLYNLENQLTPPEIERLIRSTKYEKAAILFPKMKLESTLDLTDALRYIGARSLFDSKQANLALLSSGLYQYQNRGIPQASFQSSPPRQFVSGTSDTFSFAPFSHSNPRQSQSSNLSSDYFRNNQDFTKGLIVTRLSPNVNRENQSARNRRQVTETIDSVRRLVNNNPRNENPGLYADQVLHKVYIDITETGTEAAATTSVSLAKSGDIVNFRVDQPFIFFIIDEATQLVLFWGSVTTPTPNFS